MTSRLRWVLKSVAVGGGFVLALPLIALARAGMRLGTKSPFCSCGCLLSQIPGKFGSYLRVGYYRGTLVRIDRDAHIGFCSFFSQPTAEVGKRVSIGAFSIVGSVVVEDEVLIGSHCSIMSGKNQHPEYWPAAAGERPEKLRIGRRSWIGDNCVVMATIGPNCVVSAGSVVTRAMPGDSLLVGNPARPLPRTDESSSGLKWNGGTKD